MIEETVANNVNEAPDDAAQGSAQEGVFYRSQAEIDSAIGKRLGAEKARWERANEGAIKLAEAVRKEHGEMSYEDILSEMSERALEKKAHALGLAPDSVRLIMKSDSEGLARSLIAQEKELKEEQPDFSLETMLQDPHAKLLALAGVPVKKLREFLDMPARIEREREQARLEVVENMRRRNQRVEPEGGGVDSQLGDRLSDGDVRAIDERLKRGETVYI